MSGTPVILKVSKLSDGTVHQVFLDEDNRRAETFYYPASEAMEMYPMEPPCVTDLMEPLKQPPSTFENPLKFGCSRQNMVRLAFFVLFFMQYCALVLTFVWPMNPYLLTYYRIKRDGDLLPIRITYAKPSSHLYDCYDKFFCKEYDLLPAIQTPVGTVFPNFTTDQRQPADYLKALSSAYSILMNSSCQDYTFVTNRHHSFKGSQNEFFSITTLSMSYALFLYERKCHPEALQISVNVYQFEQYGIDIAELLPKPEAGPCYLDWEKIVHKSYTPKHPERYSNCKSVNESEYWEAVDYVSFVE